MTYRRVRKAAVMTTDEALYVIENNYRVTDDDGLWEAGKVLAARVRELEGRTCETCEHRDDDSYVPAVCGKHRRLCLALNFTCGAWRKKP